MFFIIQIADMLLHAPRSRRLHSVPRDLMLSSECHRKRASYIMVTMHNLLVTLLTSSVNILLSSEKEIIYNAALCFVERLKGTGTSCTLHLVKI